jgi:signal transduction histidine kinase
MLSITDFVDRICEGELIFESELKTKDNKVYPVEIKSRLIKHYGKDAILCISRDISDRKQIERKILNAIIETEHKERERFSKDLHDQLGNILSSMNIYCELIKSATMDEIERENLMGYFKGLLNEAITSTKEIANNLNPNIIANFGLIASARAYCEKINHTGLLKIYLTTSLKDNVLSKDFEVNFYKIITELVNNTLKHAMADRVYIAISQENSNLIIKYEDNGIGFNYPKIFREKANKGMGLFNIASRVAAMGGKLSVESNKTIGTRVKIITNIF